MLQKSKLYAFGLLAAVFAAGIAVGTGVSAAASDRGERPERRTRERLSYAERLGRELALTPDQQDSVARIVNGYQDSMSGLWSEMRPRMDSVRAHIRLDILSLLDSAQQEQYRAYMHRSDSARRAREEGERHDRR